MAFASGSRVTAAALNRIIRNDLEAAVSSDQVLTTTETDLTGASITFTTTQANTKITITASMDCESTGAADLPFVNCYAGPAAGTLVALTGNLKFQRTGRDSTARTWTTTLGAAGSYTVKLKRQKIGTSNTCTIYGTHSTLVVSGNGIS